MNEPHKSERDAAAGPGTGAPRDPVTGTPALDSRESIRRDDTDEPREIQQNIRQTRAHMSDTVNAIERRLAPERIKHDLRNTVQDTIDDVQYRLSPTRLARKAGRNMRDTIREHPIPAILAGLSIGYLLVKAGDDDDRDYFDERDFSPRHGSSARYYGGGYMDPRRSQGYGYAGRSTGYDPYEAREYYGSEGRGFRDDDSMFDRGREAVSETGERIGDFAERASDSAKEAMHSAGEYMEEAGDRAMQYGRSMGRRAKRSARRAEHVIEDLLEENPLVAGALAIGAGALLGSLLPSTRFEDEWMGDTRDDLVDSAGEVAGATLDRARDVAEHMADEASDSFKEVAKTARSEARHLKGEAREGAEEVKDEASRQTKNKF
jgi:ElaB/YqjD/DUF883 family membrane-anchored ribosome-binding protein